MYEMIFKKKCVALTIAALSTDQCLMLAKPLQCHFYVNSQAFIQAFGIIALCIGLATVWCGFRYFKHLCLKRTSFALTVTARVNSSLPPLRLVGHPSEMEGVVNSSRVGGEGCKNTPPPPFRAINL